MNAAQYPPQRITYPDQRTVLDDGTVYTPFLSDGTAGLRCTRPGSPAQYIYFNVSDHTDGDVPNVFVYQGTEGHPFSDTPIHHYVIWPETPAPPAPRRLRNRSDAPASRRPPAVTARPPAATLAI
jgi:hypothetical protein